jgi:hypothetical protein
MVNVQKQASLNTYLTKRIAAFYGLYVLDAQVTCYCIVSSLVCTRESS